jgi:2-polyprenyl-6-methoxyphenol hydroxylase-like FAD-dependent oxidoreductase
MAKVATLVIGGGIGGLSLARELSIRGLPVTVLEKAPQLNPVGAGIIMNPNAMRVLERNGLAAEVRRDSWPYLTRETRDRSGRLLATRDYRPLYDSGKLAQGALVHRAHLLDVLYRSLPQGTVRFGVTAGRSELDEAELVVGADGIHSQVRREIFGETAPRYMGYRSHRFIVENSAGVRCFTEFLGRGQRIGLVPISEKRLYVWTTFNSPRDRPPVLESVGRFRELFAQFTDATVLRALSRIRSPDEVISTEIEEMRLAQWVQGRAVLLGDAVHAMTPNIGQGAGMAMEDAAVLADELAASREVAQALERYVQRRRPRVDTVMRISRQVGEDGQQSNPLACWVRNRRIRRSGRKLAQAQADLERLLAFPG